MKKHARLIKYANKNAVHPSQISGGDLVSILKHLGSRGYKAVKAETRDGQREITFRKYRSAVCYVVICAC